MTDSYPVAFPGAIYCVDGRSLDPALPDLRGEDLDAYPHRTLVTDRGVAPVARVWLLADEATWAAIPSVIIVEAVQLVLAGEGILIVARRPEPEVDVRAGLLQALDLFTTPPDEVGTA